MLQNVESESKTHYEWRMSVFLNFTVVLILFKPSAIILLSLYTFLQTNSNLFLLYMMCCELHCQVLNILYTSIIVIPTSLLFLCCVIIMITASKPMHLLCVTKRCPTCHNVCCVCHNNIYCVSQYICWISQYNSCICLGYHDGVFCVLQRHVLYMYIVVVLEAEILSIDDILKY